VTVSESRFVDLFDRHYRPVYAYCRRRTTADLVDDVVAETFLVAWRRLDVVPDGHDALPWLFTVAYKVLGNQRRSIGRHGRLAEKLASIGHQMPGLPDELYIVGEESRLVITALESLGRSDQEILRLAAWEELPHAEIADVLGISVHAVRQRLHKAKKRLAKSYDSLERRRTTPAARKGGTW